MQSTMVNIKLSLMSPVYELHLNERGHLDDVYLINSHSRFQFKEPTACLFLNVRWTFKSDHERPISLNSDDDSDDSIYDFTIHWPITLPL